MKDNFSTQSDKYAKYRPGYPAEFFNYLNSIVPVKELAWDCGTGNGQIAFELAKSFENVFATDISQSQLDNASQAPNIYYSLQSAEKTNFENNTFDLVTVGQAIHWFDFDKFFGEVRRTAKENAFICLVGYGGVNVSKEINELKKDFYTKVVGAYWDKERKYVDDNYTTLPFPFEEIEAPSFENKLRWDLEQYIGYLNTWSAVRKFIKENGFNPVEKFQKELEDLWERGEVKDLKFPLMIRLGRISR